MSAVLLAGVLFSFGPADAASASSIPPMEVAASSAPATATPREQTRRPQRRARPAFSDPFAGGSSKAPVFGDPFATPEARHRPYEPQNVHAQFDDSPPRWKRWREGRGWGGWGWGWGCGWGCGLGMGYGLGWGAGYGWGGYAWGGPYAAWTPYPYYRGPAWGRVGAGVGLGVGIGLGALGIAALAL